MNRLLKTYTFEEILDKDYGKIGTPERDRFEIRHLFRRVGYGIRDKRKELGLSREDLAKQTELDIKDITRIERGAVSTPIPKIHRVWLELGMNFVPGDKIYDDFHKQKRAHKNSLTKQSPPLCTLVR